MKVRVLPFILAAVLVSGCRHHLLTDYRPLDRAGMWFAAIEQLKQADVSDAEVAQLVKMKQAGVSDDTCVALVAAAHAKKHLLVSADAVTGLAGAGYGEPVILQIARADQLDTIGSYAVMLKLIGLSDAAGQELLQRRLQGQTVLSADEISKLKNTGLTEKQILDQIEQGMTDEQADREIAEREQNMANAGGGFVHIHGRRPH